MKPSRRRRVLILLLPLFLGACASAIAPYDHYAYVQATSLKVEALELLDLATESYEDHRVRVERFRSRMKKAYEYVRSLPRNELTARQYEILMDPDGHSIFGALRRWEESGRLSPVFVEELRGEIAQHFDQVITLEAAKIKRIP
ncbi:hypothetical protein SAMN02745206_00791 [Desulfacinum infernum DSM 9756]|uniref:DUF4296 domain-containing protein n=1 Tax=Desulfacinum infernum DSM 9756 TaxID=1121391 RepID=A0A1M4W6Q6_9BACT|nr:hypothetical protein [Desulfacinum infernum]SHE76938.1 hypothetical protein SAMN02745206_00791 [Desulfacinum infernum DSM 9756]